ncbi:MAG: NAD(P)-dependent alcohol dehydrogenase [Rhodobacter sp.]|nr:NAD(P)-dependent alcohol dehydrogenase [Rhodobacter sp.]
MSIANTLSVPRPGADPEPREFTLPDLNAWDIEVEVTHCGLCASDLHLADGDFGDASVFPQVCGHEIVGTVRAIGSEMTGWRVGERVGIGWQKGACFKCEFCLKGEEQHCIDARLTCCSGEIGGFADIVRCDGRFAYAIPEAISSAEAAPLLCAGHTTYTALMRHARPGAKVGVLGIGGLGHLAVQFADKMGCEVTAISGSPAKADEAYAYGADSFLNFRDALQRAAAAFSLDFLLVTSPRVEDWDAVFDLMRPHGIVGVAGMTEPATVNIVAMMERTLTLTTVNAGSRNDMRDMLAFCARNGVRPTIETLPMNELPKAFERLRSGEVRYRAVLTT